MENKIDSAKNSDRDYYLGGSRRMENILFSLWATVTALTFPLIHYHEKVNELGSYSATNYAIIQYLDNHFDKGCLDYKFGNVD